MPWDLAPRFDAGHRAALRGGKALIYVCPPAGWATLPLFAELAPDDQTGLTTLVLAPDPIRALDLADTLAHLESLTPVQYASGLARTARLLATGGARTLVAVPGDAVALIGRSSLRPGGLARIVIGWPEQHPPAGQAEALDTLLAESAGVQRIVLTTDERLAHDFIERHARRAPAVGAAPPPPAPVGGARFAVVGRERLAWAVRAALDTLDPERALLWDPSPAAAVRWRSYAGDHTVRVVRDPSDERVPLAIAAELPSADALAALCAAAADVLLLVDAGQVAYLRRLAHPLTAMRLPSEVDRARDAAYRLRAALRERLAAAEPPAELLALAPLFDEYDPALVAAVALGVAPTGAAELAADVPAWVRLRLDVGRRDRVRTADVVGALLNGVGLPKNHVGRVEVRDAFTLVEVRSEAAERTLRELNGMPLRGRPVAARVAQR